MPSIHITNTSQHEQEFEVHGWNDNHNITVKPRSTSTITSPSGQQKSGAIIALHDGHEGEQAEITFNGGNFEWYDISVIVGAGGNLTIEQVGKPGTRKGDPRFMQDLRKAYASADAHTKDSLKSCVHLNSRGLVSRIDAPKAYPALEAFVRTFAEGKLYIGVGAWQGNKGDPGDNAQSSGTPGGNVDLQLIYSDADSTPEIHDSLKLSVKPVSSTAGFPDSEVEQAPMGKALAHIAKTTPHPSPFVGDADNGASGITLSNKSGAECTYFFFNNYWNGNGTAGANFDHPSRSVNLRSHTSAFVSLPESFKGRVQRGKFIPATWAEFQLDAGNGSGAWGNISLEQGYDGPATIRGDSVEGGFSFDILNGAPGAAVTERAQDKVKVLASTMGNWLGGPNEAAIKWETEKVGQKLAYITGGSGTIVVNSKRKRLLVDFF
ncbi:hypothetical protein H2200_008648 [Cladophialophora chaetospira]|uniref:Uncharacterized protein n=1 Tax=Cladophialophora chaetospira TaxID=386627 RepID=A0AA39CFW1_9EURO|nr:hypothetical protein H2200_008648 [Cladophialophora chaetospira]